MRGITICGAFFKVCFLAQVAERELTGANAWRVWPLPEVHLTLDVFLKKMYFSASIGFDKLVRRPFLKFYHYWRKQPW